MSLDWCRACWRLVSKKKQPVTNPPAVEEGKQHYDCEPFASDFNKDGDQDGHQRQYVSFSIDRGIEFICGVFRPRACGGKTFAVPEPVCRQTLHVS